MDATRLVLTAPEPPEEAWLRIEVLPHQPALEAFLRARFPSLRDPEDIVQEAILRTIAVRREGTLRSAKAFLFQSARNLAIDLIRHYGRAPDEYAIATLGWACTEESPYTPETLCRQDELDFLETAIATIPPHARATFRLCLLEERTHRETATQLGICEASVHLHLQSGRRHCAQFLRKKGVIAFAKCAEFQKLAG